MIRNLYPIPRRNGASASLRGFLLTVFICMMAVAPALAQVTTSAISGHVSDGKLPIPDAVVTVLHEPTGQHYYVFTNQLGNYVINIRELERRTGIDFFCNLPDAIEEDVENTSVENIKWLWNL